MQGRVLSLVLTIILSGVAIGAPARLPAGLGIVVHGRPLTMHSPEVRGDRLFLPIAALARALGDRVVVDAARRKVTVQRLTGVRAEFDASSGEVREDGSPVLVSRTGALLFPPRDELLQLPSEIVGALLGASVVVDRAAKAVHVSRGGALSSAPRAVARGLAELYEADYRYNASVARGSYGHGLQLGAAGRLFDGRFSSQASLTGNNRDLPLQLLRASVGLSRPNRQRFSLIDFSSSADLRFLSLPVRGGMMSQPVGRTRMASVFVGATRSDAEDGKIDAEHYDTLVTGWQMLIGLDPKTARPQALNGGFGGMAFFGPERRGALVTGATRYRGGPLELGADLGLGGFRGQQIGGEEIGGVAFFTDLGARYRPRSNVLLQSQFTHIGTNFLTPLAGGGQRPMTLVAGGVNYAPWRWVNSGLRGRYIDRLDRVAGHDAEMMATLSITPPTPLPSLSASHTYGTTAEIGGFAHTLANITEEWGRWRLTADFTRSQYDDSPARMAGMLGVGVRVLRVHHFQLLQSVTNARVYGGAFNWRGNPMLAKHARLGAGFGYAYANGKATFFGRLMAQFKLPWQQTLQLDYQHNVYGYQLFVSLQGPLFRAPRRPRGQSPAELAKLRDYGDIYGRVYQDKNFNGRFDAGIDEGVPDVQVQVDGTHFIKTDASGKYRARRVRIGEHRVRLNLETVRADLTTLDAISQKVGLRVERDVILNFRLVRSGRMEGTVWLDTNGNGRLDKGEEPLGDVRMVTGTGKDTLTFHDGTFMIGDLPPGSHVLVVDEKTLPDDIKPVIRSRNIEISAGGKTRGADFPVQKIKRGVKIKDFSGGGSP